MFQGLDIVGSLVRHFVDAETSCAVRSISGMNGMASAAALVERGEISSWSEPPRVRLLEVGLLCGADRPILMVSLSLGSECWSLL